MQLLEALLELFGALLEVIARLLAPVIGKLFSVSKPSWKYLVSKSYRRSVHYRWKDYSRAEAALEILGNAVIWLLSLFIAGGFLIGMMWGLVEVFTEESARKDSGIRRTVELNRYATSLLHTIQNAEGDIGLQKKLFGEGLKEVSSTQAWVEQAQSEATWLAFRADTRTELLERLCQNKFGSPWFIQVGEDEPVTLMEWLKTHHPQTPLILYADAILNLIAAAEGEIGKRTFLPASGLKHVMPVKEWVADARIRVLWLTSDAASRAELLDRLCYDSFLSVWYLQEPERDPEPLIEWLSANHEATRAITTHWNPSHWIRRVEYAGYSVQTLLLWLLFTFPVMLAGVIMAVYKALRRTTRYEHDRLFGYVEQTIVRDRAVERDLMGLVPFSCMSAGVFALVGAVLWMTADHPPASQQATLMYIGGLSLCWLGLFSYSIHAFRTRGRQAADPGWAAGLVGGPLAGGVGGLILSLLFSAFSHLLVGLLAGVLLGIAVTFLYIVIKWVTFALVFPLLILIRFKTILCENCFRTTMPLRSRYERGIRYCEHCHRFVEYTRDPGKVIVTFGNVPKPPAGRIFVFADHDFEQRKRPMDISEVYLDPATTDKRLLERFLTYIVNYPPRRGLKAVQIFYQGSLDDLGEHLKNALRNTFPQIEQRS